MNGTVQWNNIIDEVLAKLIQLQCIVLNQFYQTFRQIDQYILFKSLLKLSHTTLLL